ncbi:MAG TPA: S1/P1 nuclease [Candidatus Polarisedimenticolaceae bacterium]|nr:S1/P1 nuclease [Candidatus Polarisedimenticolaceae bacterium]
MRSIAVLAALLLSSGAARGWGDEGHKIVGEIATRLLPLQQQREVKTLVRAIERPDGQRYAHLATASTLADTARARARAQAEAVREGVTATAARLAPWSRFAAMDRWHFLNLPRDARHLPEGTCADCVLSAIAFHWRQLADRTLSLQARGEALALLAHWVADVHQPLHVSYADDRGGTQIDRLSGVYPEARNLHDVWDNGILARGLARRGLRDWRAYAQALVTEIDPGDRARWEESHPRAWADESYVLATDEALLYCRWEDGTCRPRGRERDLTGAYQARFQPVAERRLQQAAVRLARTIADALRGS